MPRVRALEFPLRDASRAFPSPGDLNARGHDGFENARAALAHARSRADTRRGSRNTLWDIHARECGDRGAARGDIPERRRAAGDVSGGRRGAHAGDVFDDGDGGHASERDRQRECKNSERDGRREGGAGGDGTNWG